MIEVGLIQILFIDFLKLKTTWNLLYGKDFASKIFLSITRPSHCNYCPHSNGVVLVLKAPCFRGGALSGPVCDVMLCSLAIIWAAVLETVPSGFVLSKLTL